MSWDAVGLAAKAKCQNPTAKLVLIMIANYADENFSSYPSYKKLSELCGCDERTIQRAIKSLVADGMVEVMARYNDDGKQTSNTYTLKLSRGDNIAGVGVTNMPPNTIRVKQPNNTKRGDKYAPDFLEWWNAYPRNDGSKAKAYEAWMRVTDRDIGVRDLFLATCSFKRTTHGKDKKYIPHATTWLNQRRWETVAEAQAITTNRNQLAG